MTTRPETPRVPAFSYSNAYRDTEQCPWCKCDPPRRVVRREHYIDGVTVTEDHWYREGERLGVPLIAPLRNGSHP